MAPKILKLLALCSALALGGGYVWWSQKKAEEKRVRVEQEVERVSLPGSKAAVIVDEGEMAATRESIDRILNGKNSDQDGIPEDPDAEPDRTMLPGSKSGFVRPVPTEEEPKPRTGLPGSKSIDRILQPPDEEKPESP